MNYENNPFEASTSKNAAARERRQSSRAEAQEARKEKARTRRHDGSLQTLLLNISVPLIVGLLGMAAGKESAREDRRTLIQWIGVAGGCIGLVANGVATYFVANTPAGTDLHRTAILFAWLAGALAFGSLMTSTISCIIRRK